jgi:hypothetical protein
VSRLKLLAAEKALGVENPARRCRRARGKHDQGGVGGSQLGGLGGGFLRTLLVQHLVDVRRRHRRHPAGKLGQVLVLSDRQPRVCRGDPVGEIGAAQLRVARQRDRADPEAGQHREHPLGAVSDQGQDDVPAPDPARRQRPGEASGAGAELAEVPDAAPAVAVDRDERRLRRREALEDVVDEVHGDLV